LPAPDSHISPSGGRHLAFKVIGTAVRAPGCPPLPRPFTTELSGPDFAEPLMDGWVPAGIALGISAAGLLQADAPFLR